MSEMRWDTQRYLQQHGFIIDRGLALAELLAPQPGERILDLGCGTGDIASAIAARGAAVVGVDAAPEMIDAARSRFPDLDFRIVDAAALPFDAEFDGVFSHAVLHWVNAADDAVRGMRRALKTGGRLVVEFGGVGNVAALEAGFAQALKDAAGRDYVSGWYFPGIGDYAARLESKGFLVRAAWHFDLPARLQGEDGLRQWVFQFMPQHMSGLDARAIDVLLRGMEHRLRPLLWRDGAWWADYRRLRVLAQAV